jgi:uncharacterized membrane protein YkvI
VFGAAAGALGSAVFGWPALYGTLCLVAGIALFATFGNSSVERLFKWVSILLYATYAVFLVLALFRFGRLIPGQFAAPTPSDGWASGGVTYAAYNVIGAVVILPVMRHIRTDGEAVAAGLLAGPLAMLPAIVFFVCMCAFYPQIRSETLPSDFMLRQMQLPWFHWTFQLMIFAALLECGTGSVHAVNERISSARKRRGAAGLSNVARLTLAGAVLTGSVFLADRFGLVMLIARGYRILAYAMLALYVLPIMTFGVWQLFRRPAAAPV